MLQNFEMLTDEQLVSLSEADIAAYITQAAMEAGIPLHPVEPTIPQLNPPAPKNVTVYNVAGISYDSREAAEAVAKFLNARRKNQVELKRDWGIASYDNNTYVQSPALRPLGDPDEEVSVYVVSEQRYYDEDAFMREKPMLKIREEVLEPFKRERTAYLDALEKLHELDTRFRRDVFRAAARLELLNGQIDRFKLYRSNSSTDEQAQKFYEMAYGRMSRELCERCGIQYVEFVEPTKEVASDE